MENRTLKFELSEFNINVDFKDREHIDLLKKQIESGYDLPLEVYEEDGVYKVIDGGHSLQAYQELGKEPKNVKVLTFKDDADKIAYSRHKNINRLRQTPITLTKSIFAELKLRFEVETDEEVKKILRRLYNLENPNKELKANKEDRTYHDVVVGVFKNESITWQGFANHNLAYLDFPLWLAEMVDRQELSVSQASLINNSKFKDNEPLQKRIAELCKGKEVSWTKELINDITNFEPQKTAFWYFIKSMDVFGDPKFPGRCNGELVMNVLHYWSKEGDVIVDPMAGSGTTIDVCKLMNRKCIAYDLKPYLEDIAQNDIRNGFPIEAKNCDLIFLDPPYYKKKEVEYGLGQITKEEFILFIKDLAKSSFDTLKTGGICVLLISDYFGLLIPEIILSCEYWKLFKDAGFEDVMRIMSPLPLASLKATWPEPEKNLHHLLDVNRDLYIFRKPKMEIIS